MVHKESRRMPYEEFINENYSSSWNFFLTLEDCRDETFWAIFQWREGHDGICQLSSTASIFIWVSNGVTDKLQFDRRPGSRRSTKQSMDLKMY